MTMERKVHAGALPCAMFIKVQGWMLRCGRFSASPGEPKASARHTLSLPCAPRIVDYSCPWRHDSFLYSIMDALAKSPSMGAMMTFCEVVNDAVAKGSSMDILLYGERKV